MSVGVLDDIILGVRDDLGQQAGEIDQPGRPGQDAEEMECLDEEIGHGRGKGDGYVAASPSLTVG